MGKRCTLQIDGVRVGMSPRERDVFMMLYNARGAAVSVDAFMREFYANDHTGGPSDPLELFGVYVYRLRHALTPTRFRIVNRAQSRIRMGGVYSNGYRLERISPTTPRQDTA